MCQICNRTSSASLQAAIAVALIKAGVNADIVVNAASEVLTEFAKSEVSHPEWAAEILGIEKAEPNAEKAEPNAKKTTDVETVKIAPGVFMHRVNIAPTGDDETDDGDMARRLGELAAAFAGAASKK